MYLKRQKATTKLPIERKGTKYIARALSNVNNSVPLVIAVRDMLKLAKTTGEVKKMINQKMLKINWRIAKDYRESIQLFNLLEAGKIYFLSLLPTGKFVFEEAKHKDARLCKVIGKALLKNNQIQLNLHDGSNIISSNKISIGDSLYLDSSGKIKKHVSLDKGREVKIISGKYSGSDAKVHSIEGKKVSLIINDKIALLEKGRVIAQ